MTEEKKALGAQEQRNAEVWLDSRLEKAFMADVAGELPHETRVYRRSIVVRLLAAYAASLADSPSPTAQKEVMPNDGTGQNCPPQERQSAVTGAAHPTKTRIVTHTMARDAYFKLHNHVYNRGPVPLLSIPPNENDVDVLLCDYIKQQERGADSPSGTAADQLCPHNTTIGMCEICAASSPSLREKELLEVLRYYVRNNYRTPNAPKLRKEMEARAEKLLAGEPETKEG